MIAEQEAKFHTPTTVPTRLVAFLGGSLGNFSEENVLDQIELLLQGDDDHVLLDVEFVAGRTDSELASNYEDERMREFLLGPIHDAEGPGMDGVGGIDLQVVADGRSDIEGSRTIVGTVKHRNSVLELFSATKYQPDDLEQFLRGTINFWIVKKMYSEEKRPKFGQYLLKIANDDA